MKISPVFAVEIVVPKDSLKLVVSKLNRAIVLDYPEVELNYAVAQQRFETMTSFSSISLSRAIEYDCNKSNFQGDFQKLQHMMFADRQSLNFLFGNRHGFNPEGQTEKYKLPKDIAKVICEYVHENTLPILKK